MFVSTLRSCHLLLSHGRCICRLSSRMAGVYVRCVPSEEKMQISVLYSHSGEPARTYNLDRFKTEESGKAISRLQQNILKVVNKKSKRKKQKTTVEAESDEIQIPIHLFIDDQRVADRQVNEHAWIQGAELEICQKKLTVDVNTPKIKLLSLPTNMMAGFPVFPKLDMEFSCIDDCLFTWYRLKLGYPDSSESGACHKENSNGIPSDISEVSNTIMYSPSTDDIDFHLKLVCTPKYGNRTGQTVEYISTVAVSAGPGLCPFETRHLYTQKQTDDESFRVMTYNILADLYADSEFSRTKLYPYCPPYALALDYRAQLLLKEITGYNADIICLQECDKKVFDKDLVPALNVLKYDGWLKVKGGQTPEGAATFYRRSKFTLISQHEIILTEFLRDDPTNLDLWEKVCSKPALKEKLEARTNCFQVTILQSAHRPDSFLCVANTHLFFHPKSDNIRALQVGLCMRFLQQVCRPYRDKGQKISIVFCGDFNSTKFRAINILLTTGHIPEDFKDWTSAGEDETIACSLSHDFQLKSACGYADYSSYTVGFHGLLDYVFMDSQHLEVDQVIPMPDHEEVVQNVAMPSVVFPSDHIALVCDIKWKSDTSR